MERPKHRRWRRLKIPCSGHVGVPAWCRQCQSECDGRTVKSMLSEPAAKLEGQRGGNVSGRKLKRSKRRRQWWKGARNAAKKARGSDIAAWNDPVRVRTSCRQRQSKVNGRTINLMPLRLLRNENVGGGAMSGERLWKNQNSGGDDGLKYLCSGRVDVPGAANASPKVTMLVKGSKKG